MPIEDVRAEADAVFQKELARLGGRPAAPKLAGAESAFSLPSGSICQVAGHIIDSVTGLLTAFSWFIPDSIEIPARAFFFALKTVIMPSFCGTAPAVPANPPTTGP